MQRTSRQASIIAKETLELLSIDIEVSCVNYFKLHKDAPKPMLCPIWYSNTNSISYKYT